MVNCREGPDAVITQDHYAYLLEQLNFFSDLALGRNYLWKTILEKIFPINFVFSQISEEKLSKGSIFFLFLIYLYVIYNIFFIKYKNIILHIISIYILYNIYYSLLYSTFLMKSFLFIHLFLKKKK